MKKIISLLLSLVIVVSLVSCGNDPASNNPNSTSDTQIQDVATDKLDNGEIVQPDETIAPTTKEPETKKPDEETKSQTVTTTAPKEEETTSPKEDVTEKPNEQPSVSNNKVKFSNALKTLLEFYKWNPKDTIPSSLRPENKSKLTNATSISSNYSNFVSTSSIPQNGIGEQLNMVIENIEEAQVFFNTLSVIDGIASASVIAFNNYLDKNPSDTAHHQFESGVYSVTINCSENQVYYILNYSANIPVLGQQDIQIALSMNMDTEVKTARIQIGDANALSYTLNNNSYSFAIKYLNLKYSYLDFTKNADNSINGHIYEYLKASSIEIPNTADFYFNNDYAIVVGNKADGLIGFSGSICELYSTKSGEMLCYEVKESAANITYNTMWFNLYDVDGISSIKYTPKTDDQKASFSINNNASAWKAKNYGLSGGLKIASRRFDIEFRTQYFYQYDAENEKYTKISADVPMLFVQEEVYSDLIKDVKSTNDVEIKIDLEEMYIKKLNTEYNTKTELYEANKNVYTVENINKYIGNKVTFN